MHLSINNSLIVFLFILVYVPAFSLTNHSSSLVTVSVPSINIFEVASSHTIIRDKNETERNEGFMGNPVYLFAKSNSSNGFFIQVSGIWKVVNTENKKYYLEFCIFSDHDPYGNPTPVELQDSATQLSSGNYLVDKSKVIDLHHATNECYEFLLYPFVFPFQIKSAPSGLYEGSLRLILEEY